MFATLGGPGMLRRAALGTAGVVAFGIAGRHQAIALSSSTPSDAALGALWGEAIDGMIDVAAMWRTRPAWPASAAQPADWPRPTNAPCTLRHDLALREASGEPAGRGLSGLVSHKGAWGQ